MAFLDTLKKALKPETLEIVLTEVGEDFDWSVVPYSRFQKVIGERNSLKDQLAVADTASDKDPAIQFTQKDIDTALKAKETELQVNFTKETTAMKVRDAALLKLREAGAVDAEILYDSSKFSKEKLKLSDTGNLEGIAEVIKSWQTDRPALFTDHVPGGTGKLGGVDSGARENAVDAELKNIFGLTSPVNVINNSKKE